jgi:prepilin-type N-terminal cleavage/methylation domain-containing protein
MSRRRGFTLIELLVVIAIIAILAAILFPVFAQARDKARQTMCLSNQRNIGMAIIQYNQDYDETFPPSRYATGCPGNDGGVRHTPWSILIMPYVKNAGVFACPSDPGNPNLNVTTRPWCPNELVVIEGGVRRHKLKRSMIPVAMPFNDCRAAPGGIMSTNWGVTMADVPKPAGTIMMAERFENTTVCHEGSCHYKGPGDFINGTTMVPSLEPDLRHAGQPGPVDHVGPAPGPVKCLEEQCDG